MRLSAPILIACAALFLGPRPAKAEVMVNTTNGKAYYHISVTLTQDWLLPKPENRSDELAYKLSDGGMFEVYLPPNSLSGVEAPECDQVITRMPWTSPDADPRFVAEKSDLFEQILKVQDGQLDSLDVAIELNPYVEIAGDTFTITQCTVFFRNAYGQYIPHVGPLSQ